MSINKVIYKDMVMRKYEEVRKLISHYFNQFTLVSSIDSSLFDEVDQSFLSLLSLSGICISSEEFKARKELLDLLKASKKIFFEVFNLETLEVKVFSDQEKYQLLFVDENKDVFPLFSIDLVKKENYIVSFNFDCLIESIARIMSCSYNEIKNILFNEYQLSILEIKNNKNEVKQKVKEIKNTISSLYKYHVDVLDEQLDLCEQKLLTKYHIIIEVGPSNIKKGQLTLVTIEKRIQIDENELLSYLKILKEDNMNKYYKASLANIVSYQKKCLTLDSLEKGNRFCCCLDSNCLKQLENKIDTSSLYISFSGVKFSKKCIVCQNKANSIIFSGK